MHVPGAERRLLAADLEDALALEDVDHLVVAVEVVGRAPGRDQADELRHRLAADLGRRSEQELRGPAVAVALLDRGEVDDGVGRRRRAARGRGRAPSTRARRRRSPTSAVPRARDEDGRARARSVVRSCPSIVSAARARSQDVEHLVAAPSMPPAAPAAARRGRAGRWRESRSPRVLERGGASTLPRVVADVTCIRR